MATPEQIAIIRANLIGLPEEITDEVISTIIDSSKSLHDAAISLAESAASLFAGDTTIKVGSLSISGEQEAARWSAIKDNLVKRKLTGAGTIVDPGDGTTAAAATLGATVTGSSIRDMDVTSRDPDRVPNQEEVGMYDNPPSNPSGAYGGDW